MKYRYKIGAILLSICLLLPMFAVTSYAASGSVSISSKSANVGSKVTVTCSVKCSTGELGTADVVLTYDASSLEYVSGDKGNAGYSLTGGSGSVVYAGVTPSQLTSTFSFTMTFKILKAGSHKVSVSSASAYDIDETPFTPSKGSGTITGKEVQVDNRDTNNKLSSLQVYPGTLTPAFSAGTSSYTVTVPETTTEVNISATPQSTKANVTVSGGKNLKLGANEAKIVVVAENGSSFTYSINIMCGEPEKIQIGSLSNTINEAFTDEQIPSGFTRAETTYNNRTYQAVSHASGNLQLMSLQNEVGTDFYIYNSVVQEFYEFTQIILNEEKNIIILPIDNEIEEFKGYEITTVNYKNKNFDMWKLDEEFSIAYVMNQDGEKSFYRYDSVDGVFQRYVEAKAEEIGEDNSEEKALFPNEYYFYAIVALGALCIILFIAMIYFIASRKSRHEARKRKALKRIEKQKAKEEKKLEKQRRKEGF